MKTIFWAWGAILADLALFVGPLPMAHSLVAFLGIWLLHAGFCAILATATHALLPARYRTPLLFVWLLMFCIAFIAPVIGPFGMLLIAYSIQHRDAPSAHQTKLFSIMLPEFEALGKESHRAGQGAIRTKLASNVPAKIRMQSLLTLQAVPSRVANPILENLLGDQTDDVRLVAFGMLDAEEKKLSSHLHRELANLDQNLTQEQRSSCLSHLAELHWELIYTSLSQGELRKHLLGEARRYADEAIACAVKADAGLLFLRGRILLAQGEFAEAEQSISRAVVFGLPEASALPYLAEMAFQNRQFDVVFNIMRRLSQLEVTGRSQAIIDFWVGRDSVNNYSDHVILPHL